MIRHVVLFSWSTSAPAAINKMFADRLAPLPGLIPEIRSYQFGADVGLREGNFDFGVVADFDDVAGWRAYMDNTDHQAVVAEIVTPNLGVRAAVQFET